MMNLVLFGKPGAGKGTQARLLKETYGLMHISTGEVFRLNIEADTPLGKLAKSYMDEGNLVPDQVTIDMLEAEVSKHPDAKGFIFDGFPRTTAQAKALDALLASKGSSVRGTIALEVDEHLLVKRLLTRGKESSRTDDEDERKIRIRLEEYNQKTAPLLAYYERQGKLYRVDGVGAVEDIAARLKNIVEALPKQAV